MSVELGFREISDMLAARMDSLVEALRLSGPRQGQILTPLNPTRNDRNPGSFVVRLSGHQAGRWDEYATGDHGDALDLVAYVLFGNPSTREAKREAFRWAKRWLGLGDATQLAGGTPKLAKARAACEAANAQAAAEAAAALARKRGSAMRMWTEAQALRPPQPGAAPSPAWRYLTERRGLPLEQLPRLPRAVKWSAAQRHVETDRTVPCLISGLFMPDGQLVAVHRVFLEPDGSDKLQVPRGVAVRKIWPGGYQGAFIPLSRGKSGLPPKEAAAAGVKDEVFYCEGLEDGLTAAILAPEWRVCAVGAALNFAHQEPPASAGAVIVGVDNDPDPKVRAAVAKHVAKLRARARERGLTTFETRAAGGKDFNDMVRGG